MSKNSVNDIFNHLCSVMAKLDRNEISNEEAATQSRLGQTVCNLLSYELKRSAQTQQPIRELDTKAFDDKK